MTAPPSALLVSVSMEMSVIIHLLVGEGSSLISATHPTPKFWSIVRNRQTSLLWRAPLAVPSNHISLPQRSRNHVRKTRRKGIRKKGEKRPNMNHFPPTLYLPIPQKLIPVTQSTITPRSSLRRSTQLNRTAGSASQASAPN